MSRAFDAVVVRRVLSWYGSAVPFRVGDFGIVSHPFTNLNCTIDQSGNMVLLTEENWSVYREFLLDRILEGVDSVSQVVYRCNQPYRLTLAGLLRDCCESEVEYAGLLRSSWLQTEFPHQLKNGELSALFRGVSRELLMTPEELKLFAALPDEFLVYRGLQSNTARVRGFSWTLNKDVAAWFAHRWNKSGVVAQALVRKQDVLMFVDSGESEVVVDPRSLRRIVVSSVSAPEKPLVFNQ